MTLQPREKILIIGAGASYGARTKKSARPPLGLELVNWLRTNCRKLENEAYFVDLHSVLQDGRRILELHPNEENFELLISHLSRDDRIRMQQLLQITFSCLRKRKNNFDFGFNEEEDGYDLLIRALNLSDEWDVISLNYDTLFESEP